MANPFKSRAVQAPGVGITHEKRDFFSSFGNAVKNAGKGFLSPFKSRALKPSSSSGLDAGLEFADAGPRGHPDSSDQAGGFGVENNLDMGGQDPQDISGGATGDSN